MSPDGRFLISDEDTAVFFKSRRSAPTVDRKGSVTVSDSEACETYETYERAFRYRWMIRLNRIVPVPSTLVCGWVIYQSENPILAAAATAVYFIANITLSRRIAATTADIDPRGHRRALVNLSLFALALAAGSTAPSWLVAFPACFGGSLMRNKAQSLYIRLTAFGGVAAGSLLAGAAPGPIVTGILILWATSFAIDQFYIPYKDAAVAQELQSVELVRKNDALVKAMAARRAFLANMSHEIRTPLNGVLGFAQLLARTPLNEEQQELVRTIGESGEGLLKILNDVLDLSKLEAGKLHIEEISVKVEPLVVGVVDLMRVGVDLRRVSLSVDVKDVPEYITSDPTRLRQILLNLLGNAVKFTEEGSVRVVVRWSDDRLTVEVHDTGIGIAADRLESLFEPFEQADSSTTRRYGGSGLGLTISRALVRLLGGDLWVHSQPGQGSTFGFDVTAPRGSAPAAAPEAPAVEVPPARVLLVDDNAVNLKVAQAMLKRIGGEVTAVDNGPDAVQLAVDQVFDLVLTDCQMPEMDGYEATRQMRANGVTIPIVALTAGAGAEVREQCLAAGMNDVLTKPVRINELREVLIRWGQASEGENPGPETSPVGRSPSSGSRGGVGVGAEL